MDTSTSALSPRQLMQPAVLWLTFFGVGFLRPAPGTWGSFAALGVWWLWLSDLSPLTQGVLVVFYSLVSWWVCARFLSRTGMHDEPQIVADEVAGLWLALLFVPAVWWLALLARPKWGPARVLAGWIETLEAVWVSWQTTYLLA